MTDLADRSVLGAEDIVAERNPLDTTSRLQQLKQRREATLDATLTIELPSWEGNLLAEFRVLGETERSKIERRQARRAAETLTPLHLDLIATACVRLHVRDENGTAEPLVHAGQDVRFDAALAALMGWDKADTEAQIVMECFGHNTVAVRAMADRVASWMQDPRPATDQTVA